MASMCDHIFLFRVFKEYDCLGGSASNRQRPLARRGAYITVRIHSLSEEKQRAVQEPTSWDLRRLRPVKRAKTSFSTRPRHMDASKRLPVNGQGRGPNLGFSNSARCNRPEAGQSADVCFVIEDLVSHLLERKRFTKPQIQ